MYHRFLGSTSGKALHVYFQGTEASRRFETPVSLGKTSRTPRTLYVHALRYIQPQPYLFVARRNVQRTSICNAIISDTLPRSHWSATETDVEQQRVSTGLAPAVDKQVFVSIAWIFEGTTVFLPTILVCLGETRIFIICGRIVGCSPPIAYASADMHKCLLVQGIVTMVCACLQALETPETLDDEDHTQMQESVSLRDPKAPDIHLLWPE
ncbi:hypothetical protein F5I97DRAFT_1308235 [Phlebopus sp. FC_14]|nr:hypothetical protein F5I97DRAFT_1308235 [Phlebopus sp. FC_14]